MVAAAPLSRLAPTFAAGGVELYLGDAAEIVPRLAAKSIDLLCTDPPYGVAWTSGWRRAVPFEVLHGDRVGDGVDVPAILSAAVTRLRPYRHVYCFGPPELLIGVERLSDPVTLVWDKRLLGLGNLSIPWGRSHEPISFATYTPSRAGRARGDGRLSARMRQGSVIRAMRPNALGVRRHPTEKPIALMRQLIESSSCLDETVLDPFMGSGSTIVAAMLAGRRAVGIEYDPKYFEVARARVERLIPLLAALDGA